MKRSSKKKSRIDLLNVPPFLDDNPSRIDCAVSSSAAGKVGAPKIVGYDQSVIELILGSHPWLPPRAVMDFAILASFNHSQPVQ